MIVDGHLDYIEAHGTEKLPAAPEDAIYVSVMDDKGERVQKNSVPARLTPHTFAGWKAPR